MQHRDETGQPCTRHAPVAPERLLELATLGSRISGFHHDAASKLQSLVMALDEISELADPDEPDLRAAIDTAHGALRDLHALLNDNRALAKAPQRTRVALGDIVARAADRASIKLRGELASCDLRVAVPALTHALGMLMDVVAGPSHLGRVLDASVEIAGGRVKLTLLGPHDAAAKPSTHTSEALAVGAYAIHRDGGELSCAGDKIIIELPVST